MQASVDAQPELNFLPTIEPEPIPVTRRIDCAAQACLALTFDDGPSPQTTPQLLEILAEHDVLATFFMLGSQAAKYPQLVGRASREGHEIGNHSWIHRSFTKMSPPQMMDDWQRTQNTLLAAGAESVTLFRPPYGARNELVRQTIPVSLALWNVDPEDWRAHNPAELAALITNSAKPGGVVVLHDIKPMTIAAAPQFLETLKQKYHLVTMSDLLGIAPDAPKTMYFGR